MILRYNHLLLIKLIVEYEQKNKRPPKVIEAYNLNTKGGFYNQYIEENHIGGLFTPRITGNSQITDWLVSLREAGLLEESEGIAITPKGRQFVHSLPARWQDIPLKMVV